MNKNPKFNIEQKFKKLKKKNQNYKKMRIKITIQTEKIERLY